MKKLLKMCLAVIFMVTIFVQSNVKVAEAKSYPFSSLSPKNLVLRGAFYTTYSSSSEERKENIALAVKKINGTFIDIGCQFSFNKVVGKRSEENGFKTAKIIANGKFVEGVGGGVCQVSTTLYNAVLMANLKVLECHAHSLAISYVMPSFDATVSESIDFRFMNDTKNPIFIKAFADGKTIRIEIYGEKSKYRVVRENEILEYVDPEEPTIIIDTNNEYPELAKGERMFMNYGKQGVKSLGYISLYEGEKLVSKRCIRRDVYKPMRAVIIEGNATTFDDESSCENLFKIVG